MLFGRVIVYEVPLRSGHVAAAVALVRFLYIVLQARRSVVRLHTIVVLFVVLRVLLLRSCCVVFVSLDHWRVNVSVILLVVGVIPRFLW